MKKIEIQITEELIKEFRRRLFEECMPRIRNCIDRLTDDQIWYRPNNSSNSIGNLILHLEGNVRQYILSGIFDQKDIRQRQLEFDQKEIIDKEIIYSKLEVLMEEINQKIDSIQAGDLVKEKEVQGFKESVFSILVHVIEHFSYHTGQIAFYTKLLKDEDLGFYAGLDLDIKSR